MALYRTISMSFWTDSKVVDNFTPEDKYFYLYLFTNPHTNLCGCYEVSIKQIANETGYGRDAVESLLTRFINFHGVIKYSSETKEILLLNWHKYNWTKSEKFRKPLLIEIGKVKENSFRAYLSRLANIDNGSGYRIDTNCIDTSNTNTITNTVSNALNIAEVFESIWALYPRKQGKKESLEAFKRAIRDGVNPEDVEAGVRAYNTYIQESCIEPQYIKQGSSFFRQRAWADDWTPRKPRTRNGFNQFEHNTYDFDELERELTANV